MTRAENTRAAPGAYDASPWTLVLASWLASAALAIAMTAPALVALLG